MEPDEDNSSVYLILLFLAKPSKILDLYSATFNLVRMLTMTAQGLEELHPAAQAGWSSST